MDPDTPDIGKPLRNDGCKIRKPLLGTAAGSESKTSRHNGYQDQPGNDHSHGGHHPWTHMVYVFQHKENRPGIGEHANAAGDPIADSGGILGDTADQGRRLIRLIYGHGKI